MGLKVENVSKSFGLKKAVDNISFEIKEPGVFGLLGTNGAGKSTTIRMILGILKKDSGTITWNNKKVERKNVNFGYLPEERGIYPKSKVYDQLMYFALLKGENKQDAKKEIDYWMKRLEVSEYKDLEAEKLSKGNQQKIQFLVAILNDPELIILDEPFSGLDPVNTEILKSVMEELISKKKYIVMSSHQMSTIEAFCKDLVIINKGKTILKGNLNEIKNSYPISNLLINTNKDISKYLKKYNMKIITNIDNNYDIKINSEKDARELLSELINNDNIIINKYELKKPSLNDIFLEKVGK